MTRLPFPLSRNPELQIDEPAGYTDAIHYEPKDRDLSGLELVLAVFDEFERRQKAKG